MTCLQIVSIRNCQDDVSSWGSGKERFRIRIVNSFCCYSNIKFLTKEAGLFTRYSFSLSRLLIFLYSPITISKDYVSLRLSSVGAGASEPFTNTNTTRSSQDTEIITQVTITWLNQAYHLCCLSEVNKINKNMLINPLLWRPGELQFHTIHNVLPMQIFHVPNYKIPDKVGIILSLSNVKCVMGDGNVVFSQIYTYLHSFLQFWNKQNYFFIPADPEGPGVVSFILTGFSFLLFLATLPLSLCMCIKVDISGRKIYLKRKAHMYITRISGALRAPSF